MKKQRFKVLSLLLALSLTAAGCGKTAGTASSADSAKTSSAQTAESVSAGSAAAAESTASAQAADSQSAHRKHAGCGRRHRLRSQPGRGN